MQKFWIKSSEFCQKAILPSEILTLKSNKPNVSELQYMNVVSPIILITSLFHFLNVTSINTIRRGFCTLQVNLYLRQYIPEQRHHSNCKKERIRPDSPWNKESGCPLTRHSAGNSTRLDEDHSQGRCKLRLLRCKKPPKYASMNCLIYESTLD